MWISPWYFHFLFPTIVFSLKNIGDSGALQFSYTSSWLEEFGGSLSKQLTKFLWLLMHPRENTRSSKNTETEITFSIYWKLRNIYSQSHAINVCRWHFRENPSNQVERKHLRSISAKLLFGSNVWKPYSSSFYL